MWPTLWLDGARRRGVTVLCPANGFLRRGAAWSIMAFGQRGHLVFMFLPDQPRQLDGAMSITG
jgi:hypothetical protein